MGSPGPAGPPGSSHPHLAARSSKSRRSRRSVIDRFSRVFFRAFLFSPTLAMRESAFARLLREGVEANPGMIETHHQRPMDTAKDTEASPALNPALHTTSVEISASPPRAPSSGGALRVPCPSLCTFRAPALPLVSAARTLRPQLSLLDRRLF